MELIVTSEKPIGGYWDGGLKNRFCFNIEHRINGKDNKGEFVRVGSWDANFFFNVAKGKTDKLTLSNARRKINNMFKKRNLKVKFEYMENK